MSPPGAAQPAISAAQAVELLLAGGLVAFPTETSWGLGADARSPEALDRLRAFKGRAADKPLSLLVEGRAALADFCALPEPAERLARAFWPGPLTLVLPVANAPGGPRVALAPGVARDGAAGFRCSPHPAARALARQAALRGGLPITATSLNRSGEPDCRSRAEALRCIAARGEAGVALLAGEDAFGAAPSSVVAVLDGPPRILREGAIPAAQIARAAAAPAPAERLEGARL